MDLSGLDRGEEGPLPAPSPPPPRSAHRSGLPAPLLVGDRSRRTLCRDDDDARGRPPPSTTPSSWPVPEILEIAAGSLAPPAPARLAARVLRAAGTLRFGAGAGASTSSVAGVAPSSFGVGSAEEDLAARLRLAPFRARAVVFLAFLPPAFESAGAAAAAAALSPGDSRSRSKPRLLWIRARGRGEKRSR